MAGRGSVGGGRPPSRSRDRGQVAVEFVGMVPLILLLVAAVWECVLIGYAFSLAGNAADQGARAGAVKGGGECDTAARKYVGDAWNMTVDCGPAGDLYKAKVSLQIPVLFPGLGFGGIDGTAGAAMEREE
ncbi:TadE-like protein [Streptomyces lavendulae subsp. lavendulae]|uniref:TadE-like protein n=1 Tax=Streptomyces lavendulae subsp. lavendulae TaxID=58340 RepID=A0A2K8PGL2_STRLA|nr:TadE-like protein [Streptomyces lavendulae subsp. lavendulae]